MRNLRNSYTSWCLQRKEERFQCMFFLKLGGEMRRKRSNDLRQLETHWWKKPSSFSKLNTITKMLMLWIITCIIAQSTVEADEDLEITFNGKQVIELNIDSRFKSAQDTDITLLFKTSQPSGVMFLANGLSGDFIFIEMVRGKLRIVLGTAVQSSRVIFEEIIIEDNLCDDEWHQLSVKVLEDVTYARVDVSDPFTSRTSKRLKIDQKVVLGGLNQESFKNISDSTRNYTGCLSYVVSNDVFVLRRLHKQRRDLDWSCVEKSKIDVINFDQPSSNIQFPNPISTNIKLGLWFRTYHSDAVLITNETTHSLTMDKKAGNVTAFTLYFQNNVLKLRLNGLTVISMIPKEKIDFGSWHRIRILANQESITLIFDNFSKTYTFKTQRVHNFGSLVSIGSQVGEAPSFMGWIWNATMNSKTLTYLNATTIKDVSIGVYRMKDLCYPSPCNNSGRCVQNANGSHCDCSKTGYTGKTCSQKLIVYKRTCGEYYKDGVTKSGEYMIKPGQKAFKVFCDMSHPNGPVTRVFYGSKKQRKAIYESTSSSNKFYYHEITYAVPMKQLEQLILLSGSCQQYIEYHCSKSTLMFSNNKNAALINRYGARWFSRGGSIQNYWGGASKNSFKCACGMNNSCADSRLACNCDLLDGRWRSDGGYLREKDDLPVTKLQFSKRNTNPAAMYMLGPLECFGNHTEVAEIKLSRTTSKKPSRTTSTGPRFTQQTTTNLPLTTIVQSAITSPERNSLKTKLVTRKQSSPSYFQTPTKLFKYDQLSTEKTHIPKTKAILKTFKSTHETSFTTPTVRSSSDVARNSNSAVLITPSQAFDKTGGSLSAEIATTQKTITRNRASILVVHPPAKQSESVLTNKQMFILIALISSLTLFTILLIVAVLRQRIFSSSSKKLTVELKQDVENPNKYAFQLPNNNMGSFSDSNSQSRSMLDINKIEIVRVGSLFGKPPPSESESSVNSFDASRYLEVGEESDSGSYSSFTKPKSILKGNKFLLTSRPRSEGDKFDMNEPGEVIGLIHVKGKQQCDQYDENSELLANLTPEDNENVQFHLSPKTDHSEFCQKKDIGCLDCGRLESIDADTGFITDSSLSSNSRKSLSSSGSDESHDEFYIRKNAKTQQRTKRSVRFSLNEGKTDLKMQSFGQDQMIYQGCDDDVFS